MSSIAVSMVIRLLNVSFLISTLIEWVPQIAGNVFPHNEKMKHSSQAKQTAKLKGRPIKIPEEISLCTSSLPGTRFGACAIMTIPAGTWFGPFEGKLVRRDQQLEGFLSEYMWEIFHDGEVSHFLDGKEENSWMTFVQCARHKREQNMVVFQYHGCIYYRTTKEVQPGTELLIWYDSKYPQLLGLPMSWNDSRAMNSKRKPVPSPPFDATRKRRGHPFPDVKVGDHCSPLGPIASSCQLSTSVNSSFQHHQPKMSPATNDVHDERKPRYPYIPPQPFEEARQGIVESWNGFTCGTCMFAFQSKEAYDTHQCRKGLYLSSAVYPPPLQSRPLNHVRLQYGQRFQPGHPYHNESIRVRGPYPVAAEAKSKETAQDVHFHRFPVSVKQV